MPPHACRLSPRGTVRQGESGLGLEAQPAAVEGFARQHGGAIVSTYVEIETSKRSDRPDLAKARAARSAYAAKANANTLAVIREVRKTGTVSLAGIARTLEARGVGTPAGRSSGSRSKCRGCWPLDEAGADRRGELARAGESSYGGAMRLRSLLWLVAVAVFVLPSLVGPVLAFDHGKRSVAADCGHDGPPPPCPDQDTAKHAAGLCCPLMACAVALLPDAASGLPHLLSGPFAPVYARDMIGLSPHEDPPPPRV
jgi:hypothetical protein